MKTTYILNEELNGVEIYFNDKPGEEIRTELKANRFRWNGKKKCWYAKQAINTLTLAERLTEGRAATAEQIKTEIQQKAKVNKLTIEKMEEAAKAYICEETGEGMYVGWTGCNEHIVRRLSDQERKKIILAELKKNGIKATCRTSGNYMCTKYHFAVRIPEEFRKTATEYALVEPIEAFKEFVKAIVNSFNSDHSNSMIDYFDRDFYTEYTWKAA